MITHTHSFTWPSAFWTSARRVATDTPALWTPWPHGQGEDGRYRPRPAFAVASMEVCTRILARDNEVTVR